MAEEAPPFLVAQHLRDQERQLQRLPGVQARVARRLVTSAQVVFRQPTRQLTRGPGDWAGPVPHTAAGEPDDDYEYQRASGEFAGIALNEFAWERQRARRMVLIWVAVVLAITGLMATAGWTIGNHLSGLL